MYGRETVFDADRLIDLLDAFETFSEASRSARGDLDLTEDPLSQAAQARALAAAAVAGRTSTVPDGGAGAASTSGRPPLPLPFPGGFPGGAPWSAAGQLAGALTGMAAAPLGALAPGGAARRSVLASMDLEDARTREALRCAVLTSALRPQPGIAGGAAQRAAQGLRAACAGAHRAAATPQPLSMPAGLCSPLRAPSSATF